MTRLALRLVMVLGQREEEIAGMPISELQGIDGDKPLWRIRGDRTKNKLPHQLPLPALAVAIIREAIAQGGGSPFVFANDRTGRAIEGPALRKAMQRTCTRLGIVGEGARPGQRPSPHDLRRTVGTLMRQAGIDVETRAHIFNHVSGAKGKVTSWNYDAGEHNVEKLAGLRRWEARLLGIVSGENQNTVNVIPFVPEQIAGLSP
jgi:integrase